MPCHRSFVSYGSARRVTAYWLGRVLEFRELYDDWQWAERQQLEIDQRWLDCFATYQGVELRDALHVVLDTTVKVRRKIYDIRVRLVQHILFSHIAQFRRPGDLSAAF